MLDPYLPRTIGQLRSSRGVWAAPRVQGLDLDEHPRHRRGSGVRVVRRRSDIAGAPLGQYFIMLAALFDPFSRRKQKHIALGTVERRSGRRWNMGRFFWSRSGHSRSNVWPSYICRFGLFDHVSRVENSLCVCVAEARSKNGLTNDNAVLQGGGPLAKHCLALVLSLVWTLLDNCLGVRDNAAGWALDHAQRGSDTGPKRALTCSGRESCISRRNAPVQFVECGPADFTRRQKLILNRAFRQSSAIVRCFSGPTMLEGAAGCSPRAPGASQREGLQRHQRPRLQRQVQGRRGLEEGHACVRANVCRRPQRAGRGRVGLSGRSGVGVHRPGKVPGCTATFFLSYRRGQ